MRCPLCEAVEASDTLVREGRRFFRCPRCGLVFVDPAHRLSPEAERARYESHRNDPTDPAYRGFLSRLADPLFERLAPGSRGLDYGSGPGPTLSRMLTEAGHPTRDYDPFFAPDRAPPHRSYDFITCSEAAEHFHEPAREFRRMDARLRPGGWLGLMTGLIQPETDLATWWYLRDPTHVVFYSPDTLRWIARTWKWTLVPISETVALFRKGGP